MQYDWVPAEHKLYLKTHGWRLKKADYFSRHPKECTVCSGKKNIHLHHRTYINLKGELDEDLVPLCGGHHTDLHKLEKDYKLSTEDATTVFLTCKANTDYDKLTDDLYIIAIAYLKAQDA